MLDSQRAHVTDLGHANGDEPDVIMTKIPVMSGLEAGDEGSLAWDMAGSGAS